MFIEETWLRDDENRHQSQSLRELLEARRRRLAEDVQRRMTRIREGVINTTPAREPDPADADDLDLSLLEIVVRTLRRVDSAIERLDTGRYGRCVQCHGAITAARLRAVPFAVCCQECENAREQDSREPVAVRKRRWAETDAVHAAPPYDER